MMQFIKKAISNRRITFFFVVAIAIYGLLGYWQVPKQENPDITPPIAAITTVYPGASPEEVERAVTVVVEDKLIGIEGYDYSHSYSKDSISTVVIWLQRDTDVDKAWDKLRQSMTEVTSELPASCENPQVNTDLADTAGFILSISSSELTNEELVQAAEDLQRDLSRIKNVTKLEIIGEQKKEVKIEVDTRKLNQLGFSLAEVKQAIGLNSTEIPSGEINYGKTAIKVNVPGKYKSIEEIENTTMGISPTDGSILRLKDFAAISFTSKENENLIRNNGENAVLLAGYFRDEINIVDAGKEVNDSINSFEEKLSTSIKIDKVLFQPDDIKESVNKLMLNLLEGIVFVLTIVFLGMGLQNALVVSTAIPLSILITFTAMNLLGIKLHQISIAGLIIALGMLVDNAIVISDAIQVRLVNGEERLIACVKGTQEVAAPVLTSTLTTIAAYIPLLTLTGVAGDYVHSVPQMVIIALIASYLVALFFTPTMAYVFFRDRIKTKINPLTDIFIRISQYAMKHKKLVLSLVGIVLVCTLGLSSFLYLIFFPKADKNLIYLDVEAEQVASIAQTDEIIYQIEEVLKNEKEVINVTSSIGAGLPKFFMTIPLSIESPDFAQVLINFDRKRGDKEFVNNTEFANHLQAILNNSITGANVTVKELELAEPAEAPVIIRVQSDDQKGLEKTAADIEKSLAKIPGTINVDTDLGNRVYHYRIEIDNNLAGAVGITGYDIQNEINLALEGRNSSVFTYEDKDYDIVVKSDIKTIEELENLAIKSSLTGSKTLLKQIARVNLAPELPTINRYERDRTITVTSEVKSGYSAVVIENELQKELTNIDTDGVNLVFDGEKQKIAKHFGNLGMAAAFAAFLIYLIMLIQFGSLRQPLIILLTVPLSVIGSILGLLIFRQPLSFTALLGIVSLIGVVVNNAIILVDYINKELKEGEGLATACQNAVIRRIRPILLTSATTICGLIPLIIGGGTLFVPMAVALMSGLLISTILTPVVLPVVYYLANKNRPVTLD